MAHTFNLNCLLDNMANLNLASIEPFPTNQLQWLLSRFIVTWGQELPLDPANWPSANHRAKLQRFGVSNLPFSTASDFPNVTFNQLRTLALAFAYLNIYILLVDELVDSPETKSADLKLALQPVLLCFYRLLSQLFPADSLMWDETERRLNQTALMMVAEYHLQNGTPQPFTLDEFKRIGYGKMSFAPLQAIGLTLLNGSPERIPNLIKCWNALAFAAIIRDDVLDWRKDYENANYTFILTRVLFSPPFRAGIAAGHLPKIDEIMGALFCTDVIDAIYQIAAQELYKVLGLADEIDCPALAAMIQQRYKQDTTKPQELLARRMETLLKQV